MLFADCNNVHSLQLAASLVPIKPNMMSAAVPAAVSVDVFVAAQILEHKPNSILVATNTICRSLLTVPIIVLGLPCLLLLCVDPGAQAECHPGGHQCATEQADQGRHGEDQPVHGERVSGVVCVCCWMILQRRGGG
jgi:hypothetical protein